jgi:4-alpha-glucanotransferase
MDSTSFRRARERIRSRDLIDYPAVARRKQDLLARHHTAFRQGPEADDYAAFRRREGQALEHFALFESIQEVHRGRVPASLCEPGSAATRAFAAAHEARLDFHRFLQWQADRQLEAVVRTASRTGREGLYRDLAVGAHPQGAEVWSQPGLFARRVAFGAPPDAFNLQGQTWGMPPPAPRALRAAAYEPFIRLLRANLRHAAALRIDHVMALHRLFWIPDGVPAVEGAYVDYPFDDLLGIVALESRRHHCLVVGEDLGTVPAGFRERLETEHIWSYRLMLFERWPDGLFYRPDQYPERAVATFTSHDLPTLAGWWRGSDVAERVALGLLADRPPEKAEAERVQDRERLRAALADQGLPGGDTSLPEDVKEVALGVHRFLARSPAGLMMANLDDLLLEERQLNQPGTVDEYPNWRRRLARPIEDLPADLYLRTTAEAIERERESPAPPAD